MINDNNYIQVAGWMRKLGIKGNELLAFALIYGFSQDGKSEFQGSLAYICEWLGVSKQSAEKIMKRLLEKGLVEKKDIHVANHLKFVNYKVNLTACNKVVWGMQESCTHNIEHNIDTNTRRNTRRKDDSSNKTMEMIDSMGYSDIVKSTVIKWIRYKQEKGKGYKETGLRSLLTQIKHRVDQYGDYTVVDLIELCMANNWQGIIWDRLKESSRTSQNDFDEWRDILDQNRNNEIFNDHAGSVS